MTAVPASDPASRPAPASAFQAWRRAAGRQAVALLGNPLAAFGTLVVLALLVVALFAPVIATHDPLAANLDARLLPPGETYWLGTDQLGRDIFSRIVHGTRIALYIVALVALLVAPAGLVIGIVAGYFGGWVDVVLMRVTDIFLAFPRLILALAFVAALGPGIENAVIAIALTAWPPYARLARAESLTLRKADFISAVRLQGASDTRILLRHVAPLCATSVMIRLTLDLAGIILTAAGLGFLGLGAQPPSPEWGAMIASGREFLFEHWWVATMPGVAVLLVSLGFNLLGDGLRDVMDPRHE
jgi:peptide/nickel transport system permease protein